MKADLNRSEATTDSFESMSDLQFMSVVWLTVAVFLALALFPALSPLNATGTLQLPFASPTSGYEAPWVHPSQLPTKPDRSVASQNPLQWQ